MPLSTYRIAIGQVSQETDSFVLGLCELEMFRTTGFLYEREGVHRLRGTSTEIGGILAELDCADDAVILPLLAARSNSSGALSTECYQFLRDRMLSLLRDVLPVEGVLLAFHGSMASQMEDDPEGDIASAVREIVGSDVPIVMTLDMHGNITRRMVDAVDAVVTYRHYPHDDVAETGRRAARLLLRTLRGEIKPVLAFAKLPMILTGFNASTDGDGPFAELMLEADNAEKLPDILCASLSLVGSYLDVPELGCSSVVVSDGNIQAATRVAEYLSSRFWDVRHQFVVETSSVSEAIAEGREIDGGPVLLLDTADTTGGGAPGDSVYLIKGLIECGVAEPCLVSVVDPVAAQECIAAGVGAIVHIALGHAIDGRWGEPLHVSGQVTGVSDGQFQYSGGLLGGLEVSMGPSAVFDIGSIRVLICSRPTYDWADEQYRCVGLNPATSKFVGVKNMMNFRSGYASIMKGCFVLDLPGPTPPDMRMLPFLRVPRPLFPLDDIQDKPHFEVWTSRQESP